MSKFDPRVGHKFNSDHDLSVKHRPSEHDEVAAGEHSSPSTASKRSMANMSKKSPVEYLDREDNSRDHDKRSSCNVIGGIFCILFVHEDCRKQEAAAEQQGGGEDALFCTLCNAEVLPLDSDMYSIVVLHFKFLTVLVSLIVSFTLIFLFVTLCQEFYTIVNYGAL